MAGEGARNKRKGSRFELAVVKALNACGIPAKKVPLSGSATGFKGDVHAEIGGRGQSIECKWRGDGFRSLYSWLGTDNYALIAKADRCDPIVVMRFSDWCQLVGGDRDAG